MVNPLENWLPERTNNHEGKERQVGVEIELAGIQPETIAACIAKRFGGQVHANSQYDHRVAGGALGDFIVELDASYLKALAEKQGTRVVDPGSFEAFARELLTKTAEQVVPWEVVTPPLPVSQLHRLHGLVVDLREAGALGTRYTLRYAFGVHLNPELPALDTGTILNYFRAFLCSYDWIVANEDIDLVRKLTTYIKHFSKDYILRVIDAGYTPSQTGLIDDYIWANPTRNRSMDLLPLFAYLDETRVREQIDDPRINARPTLHYRLPNCDIDNPLWNLDKPWGDWLRVESLANDPERLAGMCQAYSAHLRSFVPSLENTWIKAAATWLGTL